MIARWHIRPLTVRTPADLGELGVRGAGPPPHPARFMLLSARLATPLEAPLSAVVQEAASAQGCWVGRGPVGLVLAGSDAQLRSVAAALPRSAKALAEQLSSVLESVSSPPRALQTHRGVIDLSEPRVMGIVNVTPDSFFAGGRQPDQAVAVDVALKQIEDGATFIDVGGESTRPGAAQVSAEEEIHRVIPVIRALARQSAVPISVDTCKAAVAERALEAGAWVVNDVWSLRADAELVGTCARWGCGLVLMHARGDSRTMSGLASYRSLMGEIAEELFERVQVALGAGVKASALVLDPGVGFAKLAQDNVRVLGRLGELAGLGAPLLVGASRKSFLGQVFGLNIEDRLEGSLAAVAATLEGGASILRVHDVLETARFVRVLSAIWRADSGEGPSPQRGEG